MTRPLVDVMGARKRRSRARLRRRLAILSAVLGVLGLAGGVLWLFYGSTVFAATTVEVSGTTLLTPDGVAETASVPLGGPLAAVDTAAAEDRVAALPEVASVTASRVFPHTVSIAVTERTAVLASQIGTRYIWLDAGGFGFHTARELPAGALEADLNVADPHVTAAAARVATSLPDAVRAQASRLTATTADSVVVELSDGRRVVWGSPEESELKGRVLAVLLTTKARVYDVSAPSHPTTR